MRKKFLRKGLIICLVCILFLPTIAIATTQSDSNYNLRIKVKNTNFLHKSLSPCQLLVNVSNEGPNVSNNYSVSVEIYTLFTRFQTRWFIRFHNYSYTGSPLTPNCYNMTRYTFIIWGTGWYLVKATVNSNDINTKDNVSYCLLWVQFN